MTESRCVAMPFENIAESNSHAKRKDLLPFHFVLLLTFEFIHA